MNQTNQTDQTNELSEQERLDVLNDTMASSFILVTVNIGTWSASVRAKDLEAEAAQKHNADQKLIRASIRQMEGVEEYTAVRAAFNTVRTHLYKKTIPWSSNLDGKKMGPRLLANARSLEFMKAHGDLYKDAMAALAAFEQVYDTRVAEILYNKAGNLSAAFAFPPKDEAIGKFYIKTDYSPVPTAKQFDNMTSLPDVLAQRLAERHTQRQSLLMQGALQDLGERITNELRRIIEVTSKLAAGEKTKVYDSLVTDLRNLVGIMRDTSFVNPGKIGELAGRLDALVAIPVETLKHSQKTAEIRMVQAKELLQEVEQFQWW